KNTSNKTWYCIWIMYIGQVAGDSASHSVAPFVQIGLIRRPSQKFALRAFVAERDGIAQKMRYRDFRLGERYNHTVAIRAHLGVVYLMVDNTVLWKSRMLLPVLKQPYAQFGAEANAEGDCISGGIRNTRLIAPLSSYEPDLSERHSMQGIALTGPSRELRAVGCASSKAPSFYFRESDLSVTLSQ
ncbi:MAG TPA: hypothetical protein VFL13_08510, partial [Candidatus Baltobacteraceae bacterium]|nr:hypothetical protein [Candidatus Baltobacteraceae bacterium]